MNDGLGSQSYSYNDLSQMTAETRSFAAPFNHSYTLSYEYNLAGQLKTFSSSFGETLNYGHDAIGRLQSIGASGYYPSEFLHSASYRAWDGLKSAALGDGVTESQGYNSRMQMTTRQSQFGNYQWSNSYQYYADGALRFSQSADNRFDRAFSYDQAARIMEAYSGSEARDYINGTSSGAPTGPYRQSYQYNGFSQTTQEVSRIWSQSQTTINSFTNNRLQGWSYDSDGGLTSDGTYSYARDAAGLLVWSGTSGSHNANQYDGDGRLVRTSIQSANGYESMKRYYLYSSVLGVAVSKIDENGQRQESYVYAGGEKFATASPWQAMWTHIDPVTGSRGDAEFNADGVNVGFNEPTEPAPDLRDAKFISVGGNQGCYAGSPNCVRCFIDGLESDCGRVAHLLDVGAAKPCPDNDCGPKPTTSSERPKTPPQLVPFNDPRHPYRPFDPNIEQPIHSLDATDLLRVLKTLIPSPQNPQPITVRYMNQKYVKDFLKALQEAEKRLKNGDCAKLFGKSSADLVNMLENTEYRVLTLPSGGPKYDPDKGKVSVTGAQTNSPTSVFINDKGPFFNQTPFVPGKGITTLDFGSHLRGTQFGALLLLHELGHQTGIFGSDAGNDDLNRKYTRQVQQACF